MYNGLAYAYSKLGNKERAKEFFNKANRIRMEKYNPITRDNYRRLADILKERNIQLVAVQYPIRSVKPLKRLLDGKDGIVFVDNKKIFKDALKNGRYQDYFIDSFAGDSGHCSTRGNRLLAENIADTIIEEIFPKTDRR